MNVQSRVADRHAVGAQFPASFLNFKSMIRVAPVLLPGGQASPHETSQNDLES